MNIVIRVDASPQIGLGHLMRCFTLAKQFLKQHKVTFLCNELPGETSKLILSSGATPLTVGDITPPCHEITDETARPYSKDVQTQHASVCIDLLSNTHSTKGDMLIVDHYRLSASFCTAMRPRFKNIVVIDDLANRPHDCDILLDQNLYDNLETRYKDLIPTTSHALLGPKYALLREAFYTAQKPQRSDTHILVCFGGSDPTNVTERVVDILTTLKSGDFTADIVVGAAYSHVEKLQKKLATKQNIALHHNTPHLATMMQRANFMVGAGGTMHWERAKSSIAGLIITLADNQVATTRCLDEKACCLWIGDKDTVTDGEIRKAIEFALNSPQKIREVANNARAIVGENQRPSFVMDEILNRITR